MSQAPNVLMHHPHVTRRTALQAGAVGLLGLGMNHLEPLHDGLGRGIANDETRASLLAGAQRPRRQVDVEVVWVIVGGCGHQRHPAFAADVARFPAHVGMHRAHVLGALGGGTIAGLGADSVNEGSEAKKRNRADAEGKDAAHRSILTADLAWLAIRS